MIDSALYHRLAPVSRRFQLRRLFLTLACIWTLATLAGLILWSMKVTGDFYSPWSLPVLLFSTLMASIVGAWFSLSGDEEFARTAHDIEELYPELDSSLVTALEQQPPTTHGTLGFLQQEVVRKAVYHGYQKPWARVVPQWQLLVLPVLAAAGLLAFLTSIVGQTFTQTPATTTASPGDSKELVLANIPGGFQIEPGDVEIERFSSLMVLARFDPDQLPANAELVFWNDRQQETQMAMNKSLDDPLFGTRIGSVKEPLYYRVDFDGRQSEQYRISVFEYPKLERADARLVFPEYTGKEEKLAQDVRRISGVADTRVTWMLTLNKEIRSGRLLGRDGQEFELVKDPVESRRYLVDMPITTSAKLELQLTDQDGRRNKTPPVLSIQVIGNQPPEIQQIAPAADVEVSPVEELTMTATFKDDFGIERAGLSYSMLGKQPQEIELANAIAANKQYEATHALKFETLDAEPNQLVTFYFWAEDRVANGDLRRTLGDIHLVTVRSFESIFRQGQQPAAGQPSGGGGPPGGAQGQQQGMELEELQREIVYAIWNLQRREIFNSVTDKFVEDVKVVSESQTAAIGMLDQAARNLADASLQPLIETIRGHQQNVVKRLETAATNEDATPLSDALLEAQFAYQVLLQLRSLESAVVQSQQQQQQQQGGGGGGNRRRQQMQQLQLENDENRYEEETTASEQTESAEDREDRQVLSRLRELARRQNDLNKRIKELQSALEEAETQEERDEIMDRLKRLRDEQQQILRDTEELMDRMESPENQSRMSEQAEQLEQARENARRSSEALQEGEATRAAAEGTRALRDMEELRDEFQNRSSGQFDQQMQQMRNEARDIEQEQQDIAQEMEQLDDDDNQQRRSLTDSSEESELQDRLAKQRSRVESLREEMRNTIEEAEEYEPILAERLYDAYRRSQQDSPEEALDSTAQSLERGFLNDAQQEQRRAARSIEELREGIDDAAEAVLGDETEALRRANRELQRLSNAVQGEFDRANPDDPNANPSDEQQGQPAEGQPGERSEAGESKDDQQSQQGAGGEPNEDSNPESQGGGQSDQEPRDDEQQRQGGQGTRDNPQPDGRQRDNPQRNRGQDGVPSVRQQNRQDPQGALGADPEINYDEETWSDPITGDDFMEWSDRMRDVEEMVSDPELRAQAAGIRESARSIRREIKRHARKPNWELIRMKVIEPMVELQDRVHEELIRKNGNKSLVPVDRDPVPAEFENAVQKYFEQLGRGQ